MMSMRAAPLAKADFALQVHFRPVVVTGNTQTNVRWTQVSRHRDSGSLWKVLL